MAVNSLIMAYDLKRVQALELLDQAGIGRLDRPQNIPLPAWGKLALLLEQRLLEDEGN